MHSSGVLSSLLMVAAVAYAAPAAPSISTSTITITKPSYTADSALKPSSSASAHTASSASAAPTAHYVGSTATDAKPNTAYSAALPDVVKANTRAGDQAFISQLLNAPTQADRDRMLNQPGDFVFDFNDAGAPEGSESVGRGGYSVAANQKTFPALVGLGASMTLGFLGPCGMNTAHTHPRGTELNVVVEGTLVTNFIAENGVSAVANTLTKYMMTAFPQGAIHQEFNPNCEPAVFVAGFNHADAGVAQVAQGFFGLRSDVVSATLGGVQSIDGADLDTFRDLIPANIALGVESCLAKCGIKKNAKRDLSEILGA